MNKKTSIIQKQTVSGDVLMDLKSGGRVTVKTAADLFGCRSLSSIISNFRKKGYQIESIPVEHVTRYGKKGRHVEYFIKPENR